MTFEFAHGIPELHPERRGMLSRVPGKQNWIEKTPSGNYALPPYINSAATAMKREHPNWPVSKVIQYAVEWVRRMCETGRTFGGTVKVSAAVQAAACQAYQQWMAKRAEAHATSEDIEEVSDVMEFAVKAKPKISDKPWSNFSQSDYTDEQWRRACIIKGKTKSECKFPVLEPDGTLNRNAVHAAAARLSSADLTPEERATLKRRLRGLYRILGETPPESIRMSDDEFISAMLSSWGLDDEEEGADDVSLGDEEGLALFEEALSGSLTYRLPVVEFSGGMREVSPRVYEKEILRAGRINYKGRTLEFTPQMLRSIVDSFERKPFDYVPFQFVDENNAHTDDPRRYAGRIKALRLSPDGESLRALIELTPDAERIVKHNPNFGVSVKLYPDYTRVSDGVHFGPTLVHVAGTHRPRLTDLAPWQEIAASVDDEMTLDLSDADFIASKKEYTNMPDVKQDETPRLEHKEEEGKKDSSLITLSAEEFEERIQQAVSAALSESEGRAKRLEERVRELSDARYADHVRAIKERYLREGVKPAVLDIAEQLMLSFRSEPGEITLSEGDSEVKVNRLEALARLLDNCKGQVDLSAEKGSADAAEEFSEVDDEAVKTLVNLIRK